MKLVDDRSHGIQDLSLACIGDVPGIINKYSLHKRRYHAGIDHLKVV